MLTKEIVERLVGNLITRKQTVHEPDDGENPRPREHSECDCAECFPCDTGETQCQSNDALAIYMEESSETPDFIVDCLEHGWTVNRPDYPDVKTLAIDLDGGSATRSNRTQFIKRMVNFSRQSGVSIRLIYYPHYHSKYNPIERCWAALEQFWNEAILDSVETVLNWAGNMT